MITPSNDAKPKQPKGGLYVRKAQTKPADYAKATIDSIYAEVGVGDELYIIPGCETITTEAAEGDSKTDSFKNKYVLFTTLSGSAVTFRIDPDGYNELKTHFEAGNQDIFFISGSVTESSIVVAVGDYMMAFYDMPMNMTPPAIGEDSFDITLSWETEVPESGASPFEWEKITA